jgi:hypothetical protein
MTPRAQATGSLRREVPHRRTRRRASVWAGLALACVLAALATGEAHAQSKTGTTLGQFLLIEPSARFTALGNTGVASDPDLDAVYFNPAAAGRLEHLGLQFSHVEWFAGIRYDYVAAAIPLGKWGTGFGAVTSLNSGEIDIRTVSQPLGTGERYSVSNTALGLGWAYAVTDRFSAGVQARFLQETIWHTSASTVSFDVGTLFRMAPDGLHIGSSLTNFGTSARYSGRDLNITYDEDPSRSGDNGALPGDRSTQDYPVPVLFRVGVGYPYQVSPEVQAWVAASASHPSDNSESVSGGAELRYRNQLALRLGYQNLFQKDSEEGLTAGVGFRGRLTGFGYRFDYAWADYGRLEGVHRVTLGFTF